MMNRVGYDLATLGNHEFDFGMETLDDCANLFEGTISAPISVPRTGSLSILRGRSWIREMQIGFVGVVTPDTYTKKQTYGTS